MAMFSLFAVSPVLGIVGVCVFLNDPSWMVMSILAECFMLGA
jgi:hypothetical protein